MADTVVKNERQKLIQEELHLLQIQKQRDEHELEREKEKRQNSKVKSHEVTQ